jgi:hypothetical protein
VQKQKGRSINSGLSEPYYFIFFAIICAMSARKKGISAYERKSSHHTPDKAIFHFRFLQTA